MSRFTYTYEIKDFARCNCIVITDENQGTMSVTNNIEEVVQEICEKHKLNPLQCVIVYRDSEGVWDGWNHKEQVIVILDQPTWRDAVNTFIKHWQKLQPKF